MVLPSEARLDFVRATLLVSHQDRDDAARALVRRATGALHAQQLRGLHRIPERLARRGLNLAVIEVTLSYIDDGRAQAVARETLWYAAKAAQLVRIEREGRTPDESAARIVAELVEMR